VLSTLKEIQLATLYVLSFVIRCSARVSALVIVFSDSPCEKIGNYNTFPILKEDRSLVRV
jgi:hypothetical protein